MNAYGYPESVWCRFEKPIHAGELVDVGCNLQSFTVSDTSSRPVIVIQWDGAVARFRAHGCPVTIALGEWLCEQLEGRGLADWREIRASEIRQALEIPDDKAHIALIGEDVVKAT